jgi:hypothetical protein
MSRFVAHLLLGALAVWFGSFLLPHVTADGKTTTFLLLGFLLAAGEVVIRVLMSLVAAPLFFLPRAGRVFLLRIASVGVAASLTSGFGFTALLPGVISLTILVSLFYWLPVARSS